MSIVKSPMSGLGRYLEKSADLSISPATHDNETRNGKLIGEDREAFGDGQDVKKRWYPHMKPAPELKQQVESLAAKQNCSVRTILWQLLRAGLESQRKAKSAH